nr:hypothetical protein Q903MT_gene3550 [Picea sitchensis]
MGTIILPITITLYTLITTLFVIEKSLSYNLLLGNHWIYCMCVIPSTLFKQVQFTFQGKVYIIPSDPNLYEFFPI